MKEPNKRYDYDMSNYFYSKKWQNKDNVKRVDLSNKDRLKAE